MSRSDLAVDAHRRPVRLDALSGSAHCGDVLGQATSLVIERTELTELILAQAPRLAVVLLAPGAVLSVEVVAQLAQRLVRVSAVSDAAAATSGPARCLPGGCTY